MTRTARLLKLLRLGYRQVLADNLVGIYLHGSYVLGGYQEVSSDLDYLVVVHRPLTTSEKLRLMTWTLKKLWPLAPRKGLEFHILLAKQVVHFEAPVAFEFHFSKMHYLTYQQAPMAYIQRMHGFDPDLTAHLSCQ
ncbi:nucleotidyltransferase domain-containing protein [Lactobacillus sp. CC-MHH1034]|uniref:nucleotidyltransferase domain-containing protein n=1 Tax=Agrilactobacillus fermenti TaxID=2586909 RepID=UPI001E2F3143|nr:nucleotidyltransferase domain-containing protein [Agrilactobacillus fermenti]MCD2256369.1 nucleotidyltransferase domain-containing protein [Agrilactobacillus fermenti]